jgi:hypothetical protein
MDKNVFALARPSKHFILEFFLLVFTTKEEISKGKIANLSFGFKYQ